MLEALNILHYKSGKEKVNIVVGRFQPFTLGHGKILEQLYKENNLPIVVFLVKSGKVDESNPFDLDTQLYMLNKLKKTYNIKDIKVIKFASIDAIFNELRPEYEPVLWGVGTDRLDAYNKQVFKKEYRDDLNVLPEFKTFEIKRNDEDISATKVRNSIKNNDFETFKKMMPKDLFDSFSLLKDKIIPKTIMSFSEFIKK